MISNKGLPASDPPLYWPIRRRPTASGIVATDSPTSYGARSIVSRTRDSGAGTLEVPQHQYMTLQEFKDTFQWKLESWKGFPSEIGLENGRRMKVIPFVSEKQYEGHDNARLFHAVSEGVFWGNPEPFFDLQSKYPNRKVKGVVIGSITGGVPRKQIVLIPVG